MKWLVEQGADLNLRNRQLIRPIDFAMVTHRIDVLEVIFAHGCPEKVLAEKAGPQNVTIAQRFAESRVNNRFRDVAPERLEAIAKFLERR